MVFRKGKYKRFILDKFDEALKDGKKSINGGYHYFNSTIKELIDEGSLAYERIVHRGTIFGGVYIYKGEMFEHYNPGGSKDKLKHIKQGG